MTTGQGVNSDGGSAVKFAVPLQICTLLREFEKPWWVAGGWAIDLFLGRATRPHKDIEIALPRHDQAALQAHLSTWRFRKAAGGRRCTWARGEYLELPIHEIHGRGPGGQKLEVLLNEFRDGQWLFRRDPRITRPVALLADRTAGGVPFLRPDVVLLYKSKRPGANDQADFRRTAPLVSTDSRRWLRAALGLHLPGHPWLAVL